MHKTTVWRWLLGFVQALFPLLQDLLKDKVCAAVVLIDETWLTLKGVWSYWFVAIDAATGLPLASSLSPSRSAWACRYMGATLRALGLSINAIVTDGLHSDAALLPEVAHQLCIFHHQQDLLRWCRQHLGDSEKARSCQQQMLTLVQTTDTRTLRRRLERLVRMADPLGIRPWIEKLMEQLDRLLPAIGSRLIPRTTNGIARFFRAFNRFYTTRCGVHSLSSARWELALCLLVSLFTKQDKDGQAPIEAILPQASAMPLYRLITDPFAVLLGLDHVTLPQKMADDELAVALAA